MSATELHLLEPGFSFATIHFILLQYFHYYLPITCQVQGSVLAAMLLKTASLECYLYIHKD